MLFLIGRYQKRLSVYYYNLILIQVVPILIWLSLPRPIYYLICMSEHVFCKYTKSDNIRYLSLNYTIILLRNIIVFVVYKTPSAQIEINNL